MSLLTTCTCARGAKRVRGEPEPKAGQIYNCLRLRDPYLAAYRTLRRSCEDRYFDGAAYTYVQAPTLLPSPSLTRPNALALAEAAKAVGASIENAVMFGRDLRGFYVNTIDAASLARAFYSHVTDKELVSELRYGALLTPPSLNLWYDNIALGVGTAFALETYGALPDDILRFYEWRREKGPYFAGTRTEELAAMVPPTYALSALSNAVILARHGAPYAQALGWGTLLARANAKFDASAALASLPGVVSAFAAACHTYGSMAGGYDAWHRMRYGGWPRNLPADTTRVEPSFETAREHKATAAIITRLNAKRVGLPGTIARLVYLLPQMEAPWEPRATVPNAVAPVAAAFVPAAYVKDKMITQGRLAIMPAAIGWYAFKSASGGLPFIFARETGGTPTVLTPANADCLRFLCGLYGAPVYDGLTPLSHKENLLWQAAFNPGMFQAVVSSDYTLRTAYRLAMRQDAANEYFGHAFTLFRGFSYVGTGSLTDYATGAAASDSPRLKVNKYIPDITIA